jgi:pimeloyl-ACP methyl ester carboxylesterase
MQLASKGTEGASVSAGLRGASWDVARMATPYTMTPHVLFTQDGQRTLGFLFSRGGETSVVCMMHPREMIVTNYLVPDILEAGCACWVQGPRSVGNDLRLEHEIALFDVAAGMSHLKALGFHKTILLGLSGGAGLYAFYNQQSLTAPQARIAQTPGGRPTKLAELDMPVADALVFVSPHPGQGKLLMAGIDPSVVDEAQPLQSDAALDPFNPKNGFRRPLDSSSYAPEFMEKYRAAQIRRVEKLDAFSRDLIAEKMAARKRLKEAPNRDDKWRSSYAPVFNVWRTDADLRCWDLSLDPSDRRIGSLWGPDPTVSNLGSVGFARVVTPESWLSTWSGLSSNASFEKCGASVEQPTLLVAYTGDNCVFPSDLHTIFAGLQTSQKTRVNFRGNHHGLPLAAGEEPGQIQAGLAIQHWLNDTVVVR